MDNESTMIEKKILYAGTRNVPFNDGTKVKFHFQTRMCDTENTLIDDSRKMGDNTPLELILGKKFKMEVWEAILQKMALNEVAKFTVDKSLVVQYPFVSKTIRDSNAKVEHRSHCCAMTVQTEGIGYDDLNNLLKNPCDLEFTMELVDVVQPDNYEKETWQMSEDERTDLIPHLKETGNIEFKNKNYKVAAEHYSKAIGLLEQLMMKEKPHDVEWNEYNAQKLPILLNFAQCKLYEHDYYAVIEHCNTVLKSEPDNVKALFRRGKAHVGAWNPIEGKQDFEKVLELDPTTISIVRKEISILEDMIIAKNHQDKQKLRNLFT